MTFDLTQPVVTHVRNCWAVHDGTNCRPRYFRLMLYPEAISLREAARRSVEWVHHTWRPEDDRMDGVFHTTPFRSRWDKREKRWVDASTAFAGIMRLHAGRMTAEVVAHESAHAALHITRLHDWSIGDHSGQANFGGEVSQTEEDFAYLLGGIVDVVTYRVREYLARFDEAIEERYHFKEE